jgi:hypothetical protein
LESEDFEKSDLVAVSSSFFPGFKEISDLGLFFS